MKAQWALIGETGNPFSEWAADLLLKTASYEVSNTDGNIYFRTSYEERSREQQIEFSRKVSAKNYKDTTYCNLLSSHGLVDYKGGLPETSRIFNILEDHEDFDKFNKMSVALFFSKNEDIPKLFIETLAPHFFDLFPSGSIYTYQIGKGIQLKLSALRILGAVDKIAKRRFYDINKIKSFLTLHGAQPSGIANPNKYLSIPIALTLPKPQGFVCPRMLSGAIFWFGGKTKETRKHFPNTGVDYFRSLSSSALFEEKNVRSGDRKMDQEELDSYSLIEADYDSADWWNFILQYKNKLNKFLLYVTDPAIFKDGSGAWANLTHYLVWLSFERICDDVLFLLTEENLYLRKIAGFKILDQLASLKHSEPRAQVETFNRFIVPEDDSIRKALSRYRGRIGEYLVNQLVELRDNLKKSILSGISYGAKHEVNLKKVIPFTGNELSEDDYVRKVVRQLRNTSHGFSAANDILLTNQGNIPDNFPLLGVLCFFAYLAEPKLFLRSSWD